MFWALSTSTMNLFGRVLPKVVEWWMSEGENLAARAAPVTARSGRKTEAMGRRDADRSRGRKRMEGLRLYEER